MDVNNLPQSGTADIWLSTKAVAAGTGLRSLGTQRAVLTWDVHTRQIDIVLAEPTSQTSIVRANVMEVTRLVITSTYYLLRINDTVYHLQPRSASQTKGGADVASLLSHGLSDAFNESLVPMHEFTRFVRSHIPDKVVGGMITTKTRIIIGIIFGLLLVAGVIVYSVATNV